jgi:hypothetical protein
MGKLGDILLREETEERFIRRFLGFYRSSFWLQQYESDGVMIVRNSGVRQGPQNFDLLNKFRITSLKK